MRCSPPACSRTCTAGRADRRAPNCRPVGHPATDKAPTVWECVQHTARVLAAEDGGAEAAAALVGQMGPKAADARTLAYRLFEIATKKSWAAEALVYNELAEEWPQLEDLAADARHAPAGAAPQADMFQELAEMSTAWRRREGNAPRVQDGLFPSAQGPHALRRSADEARPRRATGCTTPAAPPAAARTTRSTLTAAEDHDRQLARCFRRGVRPQ